MGKRSLRIPVLLNIEPHYVKLKFPCDEEITADGITRAVRAYFETVFHISRQTVLSPQEVPMQLRYITDPNQAFDKGCGTLDDVASKLGLSSTVALNPTSIVRDRAFVWYREIGHHIVSEVLPSSSPIPLPSKQSPIVQLYVVVRIVLEAEQYRPHFLPSFNEQLTNHIKYFLASKNDLQRRMSTLDISSPSLVSKNPVTLDYAQASTTRISMGYRPYDVFGPLPALFCPPFAYAHNTSKDLASVKIETPKGLRLGTEGFNMVVWVQHFAQCCCAVTEGERNLGDTIDQYLRQLVDDEDLTRHSTYVDDIGTGTEIDWAGKCLTAHGIAAIYLAIELKETPLSGGEPITQVSFSFQRSISLLEEYEFLLRISCCPCVLVGISGFRVTVALAYFTDCIHTSELFTMSLQGSNDETTMRDIIAKFQILRDTAKRMRDWYATLHTGSIIPHLPYLFPQPLSVIPFLDPDNHQVLDTIKSLRLVFTTKVGPREKSTRCLYKGVISPSGYLMKVYIKFVKHRTYGQERHTYGQKQHQLLANHHFAPPLHICCEVVHGITMVVMDDLGACSLTAGFARKYIPTIRRDLTAAIDLLKVENYVHGDLRPENVVVKREEDGGTRAYLIDFDWAGVAGEARYPGFLNPDIDWPRPVEDTEGQVITENDDSIMLDKLLDEGDDSDSAKRSREEEEGDRQPRKKSRDDDGARPARTSTRMRTARTSSGAKPRTSGSGVKPRASGSGAKPRASGSGAKPRTSGSAKNE